MPIVIREVVSEVILESSETEPIQLESASEAEVEEIVRRATARVIEYLRREWAR